LIQLLERARIGLKEMPSNAVWLMSHALRPVSEVPGVGGSAAARVRDQGRKVEAAVVDAVPVGGDSVEIRMRRAQEAADRAREAEDRAREAAQDAKASAERAKQVSEEGRTRLREFERQADRDVARRVAEAQKTAEEFVRRERRAAETDAEEERREVADEFQSELEDAQSDAEDSRRRAEECVAEAVERIAEARQLADDAAEAARVAAEEAERHAKELAQQAERQASAADAKVVATEDLREQLVTSAKQTARALNKETTNGLSSYNKAELVELAAGIGIRGRSTMTKEELVAALRSASRRQGASR
jgi:hypothetical protein